MQFKIGENVRVRHHTEEEKQRYGFWWHPLMDMLEGQIVTVVDAMVTDDYKRVYKIKVGDASLWILEDCLIDASLISIDASLSSINYDAF